MISQTSSYGIRALAELARTGGSPMCVRELAIRSAVPPPFLGKIMNLLSRRRLVYNQRGRRGGSALQRPATEISLYDVCEALDDPVIQSLCLLGGTPCSDDRACPAHEFWREHRARLVEFLRRTTIQQIADFGTEYIPLHAMETRSRNGAAPRAPDAWSGAGSRSMAALDAVERLAPHVGQAGQEGRPASAEPRHRGILTLVSGPSGSGKTTYCADAARRARSSGLAVGGILSVSDPAEGERQRIVAVDLRTNTRRTLAVIEGCHAESQGHATQPEGPTSGRWRFDQCTIEWACEVLQTATPCDLLVVDEIGPLELRHGKGIAIALDVLDSGEFDEALVTVRPSALAILRDRWPLAAVVRLEGGEREAPWNQS